MKTECSSIHTTEKDVVRRWWALPGGVLLPLSNGNHYQLIYAGRPGAASGPDVRDAVLCPALAPCEHHVGDVEFHVRASDWFAHLHQGDARYNSVILHVVLLLDDPAPVLRQDGASIPTCSLYDLSPTVITTTHWPCQQVSAQMSEVERTQLLRHAGLLRFEQKMQAFVELLRDSHAQGPFSAYDTCLIPALAEGLGYGRDRAFFRAAGHYLLGIAGNTPEPLGRTPDPPPLDAGRLRVLQALVQQWRTSGSWQALRKTLYPGVQGTAPGQTIHKLRAEFHGLSTSRADILICNVVLPFAAAVALLEHDMLLAEQARVLYMQYPGLSSNQVTRAMTKQLRLDSEPKGACQQQGLHYIYQQTCREKRCKLCIVGKMDI